MITYKMSRITSKGFNELVLQKEKILQDLKKAHEDLVKARDLGDLRENADYHATKELISTLNARLAKVEDDINSAIVIEEDTQDQKNSQKILKFGSSFIGILTSSTHPNMNREQTFTIVGSTEANFSEGKIDEKNPLGIALLGKKEKDHISINDDTIQILIKKIL